MHVAGPKSGRLFVGQQRRAEAREYLNKAQLFYKRSLADDQKNRRLSREFDELPTIGGPTPEIH